jgi:hypothetical protein
MEQATASVTLRVIDSSTVESCDREGMTVWRLEAQSGTRRDTLRRIMQPLPVVVSESLVHGLLAARRVCEVRLFEYNGNTGRITLNHLPADAWAYFTDVSPSPDGRYLLYLATTTRGEEALAIRRWPAAAVVLEGPWRNGCECDVDRHHACWVSADSFELGTRIGLRDRYERVSGSVSARRIHVDTLVAPPTYWHPKAPRP